MAKSELIEALINRPGTSQAERVAEALAPEYAPPDGRSAAERLLAMSRLSKHIRFPAGSADWSAWFPLDSVEDAERILASSEGRVPPHLSLAAAFARLMDGPVSALDGFTARHLDHYYLDVLGLTRKAARPDQAVVLLELKRGAAPLVIGPEHRFTAGKDPTGVERLYAPTGSTVIHHGQVSSLCSVYRGEDGQVRFAAIANSADGFGAALPPEDPSFLGFGSEALPVASLGFAVASPALRLREGQRSITLELDLSGVPSTLPTGFWTDAFEVSLTGPKGWIEPDTVTATWSGTTLTLTLSLSKDLPAVVDYQSKLHGLTVDASAPVLQVQLRSVAGLRTHKDLAAAWVKAARVKVAVSGLSPSSVENDHGTLNPKKPFQPFGPVPTAGSQLKIGCDEALSKRVSSLDITVNWKGLPSQNLADWYANYPTRVSSNSFFKARLIYADSSGRAAESSVSLFDATDATRDVVWTTGSHQARSVKVGDKERIFALSKAGAPWATSQSQSRVLHKPTLQSATTIPLEVSPGFVTVALSSSLFHVDYRRALTQQVLEYAKTGVIMVGDNKSDTSALVKEPYTPLIGDLRIAYEAATEKVKISSDKLDDFAHPDLQFYHIGCFGQRREHGYQRAQFRGVEDKNVPLLPEHEDEGELHIGLSALSPGDSASLLFQVADGSADAEKLPAEIRWSVLCDNYWCPLDPRDLALDTCNHLLTSGVIQLVVPLNATTSNTIMPTGLLWFKASIKKEISAVSRLLAVANNAALVSFLDQGNDPAHLERALPAMSITKVKTPLPSLKGVQQPYASFGGAPTEQDAPLRVRVSERLRHKNRCITPWDYERVVLEEFPQLHRVKCIPHASPTSWVAPGHTTLVLVPDLRNRSTLSSLQPKVDAQTLSEVVQKLSPRMGMGVLLHVKNPSYHRIALSFKVRFRQGLEFNTSRNMLETEIIQALSPWAFDTTRALSFGGRVYRSVILDFVEDLSYVDFVEEFKMFSLPEGAVTGPDLHVVVPDRPDAILVSADRHTITQAT